MQALFFVYVRSRRKNKKFAQKFAQLSDFILIFAAEPGIRYRDDEKKNFCVAIKS